MATFVRIPGACHGGWWFDPLVEDLEGGDSVLPGCPVIGTVHEWDTRHNLMHDGPGRVLGLLLELAAAAGR